MSPYEIVAICLSIIAILIPIIQWIWKNWIKKLDLKFYDNGKIGLFFNQSGSYVRIDGAFESINKASSLKKINIKIIRGLDDNKLNLAWSTFISPVNQNIVGNYLSSTEVAHPFRIEANSVMCAFTEYVDPANIAYIDFSQATQKLFSLGEQILEENKDYNIFEKAYQKLPEYIEAKNTISKRLFWDVGQYKTEIEVIYNNTRKVFKYKFSVDENEYKRLRENIDELLLCNFKQRMGQMVQFKGSIKVDFLPAD